MRRVNDNIKNYVRKSEEKELSRKQIYLDFIPIIMYSVIGFYISYFNQVPNITNLMYILIITNVVIMIWMISFSFLRNLESSDKRFIYRGMVSLNKAISLFLLGNMITQIQGNNIVILLVYLYVCIMWLLAHFYKIMIEAPKRNYNKKTDEEILRVYTRNAIYCGFAFMLAAFFLGQGLHWGYVLLVTVIMYLSIADAYIIASNFIRYFYCKKYSIYN